MRAIENTLYTKLENREMANALKIDTLKLAEDLEEANGDPRRTARVIGDTVGSIDISALATKLDIAEVKQDIVEVRTEIVEVRTEIAEVKSELKHEIAEVKSELKQDIAEVKSELKHEIAGVRKDVNWIKLIGGAILAATVLPLLAPSVAALFK